MNVAVLSDIHGFAPALEAVLADIRDQEIDQIVVAGDLCKGGPDPGRVIELVRKHGIRCVYGNTDEDLLADEPAASELSQWTRRNIGVEGMAFLGSLPFSIRIPHHNGGGDPSTDLLVVHANPTDVNRHLSPTASDREVKEILGGEIARTIAFGHLHVAYTREINGTTLVDVAAVGNPRDGDLRPRYVVFGDDRDLGWSHRYRYVEYPLEETRRRMEDSGMPQWEQAFDYLRSAGYNRPI
jgi:predicted phosphodiesterase